MKNLDCKVLPAFNNINQEMGELDSLQQSYIKLLLAAHETWNEVHRKFEKFPEYENNDNVTDLLMFIDLLFQLFGEYRG